MQPRDSVPPRGRRRTVREPGRASSGERAARAISGAAGRLAGVDLARALAMIGMLMVHVGPMYGESFSERLYALPHGRASVLFMLVAGVGVSLLATSRTESPAALTSRLLWRAALLLPAGLVLQEIDTGRLVILQTYAAMFVVAIALVYLADRILLLVAAASAFAGPLAFLYGRIHEPFVFSRSPISWEQAPFEILHGLLLSGPYPLITWLAPFALGMWIGRRDLRAVRVRGSLVLAGGAAVIAAAGTAAALQLVWSEPTSDPGLVNLVSMAPHSQMPLWLAGSTASAVLVLGLSLFLADIAERTFWPLVATGQVALTFYVAHLLVLTEWPRATQSGAPEEAAAICAAFTAVVALGAMGWRAMLPRGPLELLLQPPWLAVRRRVSVRH